MASRESIQFRQDGSRKVLWFSRGRGRGHAIPDMEIHRRLPAAADLQVLFACYGTGARTFAERGVPCIDMGLPDANGTAETTVIAGRMIGHLRPDIVVSHEEFAALPVAKIFGIRTVMILDFFTNPEMYSMQSLRFADHILFPGTQGIFAEPDTVAGRVHYVRPVLREFTYQPRDRDRARQELGLDLQATVVALLPGSWTEAMVPCFDSVVASMEPGMHLAWLAGRDPAAEAWDAHPDVTVLGFDPQPDRIMAACDVAITKSNRVTVTELASLGVKTISLAHGGNPIDEQAIAALATNTMLQQTLTREVLRRILESPAPQRVAWGGGECASVLTSLLVG
jgi:hypothetical protein